MTHETYCQTCRKRQAGGCRSMSFAAVRRAIRARVERVKQAVSASASFETELQVVSVASLLAASAVVYMIYVVTSLFNEW